MPPMTACGYSAPAEALRKSKDWIIPRRPAPG
jgi:hypothetical protein